MKADLSAAGDHVNYTLACCKQHLSPPHLLWHLSHCLPEAFNYNFRACWDSLLSAPISRYLFIRFSPGWRRSAAPLTHCSCCHCSCNQIQEQPLSALLLSQPPSCIIDEQIFRAAVQSGAACLSAWHCCWSGTVMAHSGVPPAAN